MRIETFEDWRKANSGVKLYSKYDQIMYYMIELSNLYNIHMGRNVTTLQYRRAVRDAKTLIKKTQKLDLTKGILKVSSKHVRMGLIFPF